MLFGGAGEQDVTDKEQGSTDAVGTQSHGHSTGNQSDMGPREGRAGDPEK